MDVVAFFIVSSGRFRSVMQKARPQRPQDDSKNNGTKHQDEQRDIKEEHSSDRSSTLHRPRAGHLKFSLNRSGQATLLEPPLPINSYKTDKLARCSKDFFAVP